MAECPQCSTSCVSGAHFCHLCGSSLDVDESVLLPSSDPLVGRVIADRYRIGAVIGRGGMGVVYRGEHVQMGKTVAIKLLHGELAANRDLVKRFKREAEAISRLSSIHTVTIFDYGRSQGLIFLVMEYLHGRDVGWIVRKEGRMPLLRACMVLVQACDSLVEAHGLGVVHRDLKPENVFLLDRPDLKDFVKILDFGLAKVRPEIKRPDDTAHGAVLGTPYYMPPEQIRGDNVDHRADIYAMGGLLHCLVTGHPPFRGPTALAVMAAHLTQPPPDLSDSGLEPEVVSAVAPVLGRCLAKEPDERYARVADLKQDLLDVLERFYVAGHTPVAGLPSGFGKAMDPAGAEAAREPARLKEEFERFERRLRLRRIALTVLPVALVIALAAGALTALHGRARPPGGDVEPNDTPARASPIEPGRPATGTMGRRMSLTESDHDWYVFERADRSLIRIHLGRLPNVDLMLQIFASGSGKALATASSGGQGEDEAISSIRLDPGRYFLLVRQDLSRRGRPVEVISDSYVLSLEILDPGTWEEEPNDTIEGATGVRRGSERKGYVSSPDDRDIFCIEGGPGPVDVSLVTTSRTPLCLKSVDLATGAWSEHPSGSAKSLVHSQKGGLCVQVGAGGSAFDVRTSYTLVVK